MRSLPLTVLFLRIIPLCACLLLMLPVLAQQRYPSPLSGPGIAAARWVQPALLPAALAVSPDGASIAVTQGYNLIAIYRTADGACIRTLNRPVTAVQALAFSPDGQLLASEHEDGLILLRRVSDGTLLRIIRDFPATNCLAFSPDGVLLSDGNKVWQVGTGGWICSLFSDGSAVHGVAFSPDGLSVVTANENGARLHQVSNGQCVRTFNGNALCGVVFSPDGTLLATCGTQVQVWQVSDGTNLRTISYSDPNTVNTVAFSPDGALLAYGDSTGQVFLDRVSDGTNVQTLTGDTLEMRKLAFLGDGQTLATVGDDCNLRLWEVSTGNSFRTITQPSNGSNVVAVSADGQMLAASDRDNHITIRRTSDGTLLRTLNGHTAQITGLAFAPDGQTLASSSHDRTVKLWQVSDGTCLRTLSGHQDGVTNITFTPDGGTLITTSSDCTAICWRMSDGTILRTLGGHTGAINALALSSDGQTLATGSEDNTVKLWQVSDGACLRTLTDFTSPVKALAFSPNGATLATGDAQAQLKCWQVSNGACLRTWSNKPWDRYGTMQEISALAVSPDGAMLAVSSCSPGAITYWRLSDGASLWTQDGMRCGVMSFTFMPDGYTLIAGGPDGVARWRVTDSQPDLQIRPMDDPGYTGAGVYNYDGMPSVEVSAQSTTTAYAIKLVNDGPVEMQYQLFGNAGGSPGWSVRYFDALTGGNDITQFANSLNCLVPLAPGAMREFRAEVSHDATENYPNYYSVNFIAYSLQLTDRIFSDTYYYKDISDVSLRVALLGPQPMHTPIKLTAFARGGLGVQYKFRAGYQDAAGWHWSNLTDYQASASCMWTPETPHLYTLVVWARAGSSIRVYDRTTWYTYRITSPLSAVSLGVSPHTPQRTYTALALTATPTGGAQVEYQFRAGWQDASGWHWGVLQDYSPKSTCIWTPIFPRLYKLVVWAREQGSSKPYMVCRAADYRINPTPITSITFTAAPTAPQQANTLITLSAEAIGGYFMLYKFKVGYQDTVGWHWSDLTDYQHATTYTWIPSVTRTYTLVVYAREAGSDLNYQRYQTLVYRVTP